MAQSLPRQNYHVESEAALNRQINLCLSASYAYQSMAFYFDRDDIALGNFHKYLKKLSDEHRESADKLLTYQNQRGGRAVMQDIKKPDRDEWGTGIDVMQAALNLEKAINQSFLDVHMIAEKNKDPQMCDYIEEYLEDQVARIKKHADHIASLRRNGPGLGEYLFDKHTLC